MRDLGNAALAAVGIASFANFIAGAPIMGLSAGVQAMHSRLSASAPHAGSRLQ